MAANKERTCIVLGNGPSLRGFDFHSLSGFDTLGMNAAYRHWDRIGWYPTLYACLDDQLIKTHHSEIDRLFADGLVKKVFVHDLFFEHHSHRRGHPDFTSFYQTSEHWFNEKGKAKGLTSLYECPAFRMSKPSKVTTGSHAVRYVANMGYVSIALLGIDLQYVEVIPEAAKTDGIGLVMKTTPKINPNYFFDFYQKAGDLFNIPNPDVHNGKLHEIAFEMIRRDFEENAVDCRIVNCNRQSILFDKEIFPFVPIHELLNESLLGCIFVPTNAREVNIIVGNFKLWSMPEFAPATDGVRGDRPALVLIFNNGSARQYQSRIREAYDDFGIGRYFCDLIFEYLTLEGEADTHVHDYTHPVGDLEFDAGPINQFFQSLRRVAKYGRYGFLMETDCLPIRHGWLSRLQKLVDGSEPFWVMGSHFSDVHKLDKDYVCHLNGNSVYAVGDTGFQCFFSDFCKSQTWRLALAKDKRLTYDCILEVMFSEARIHDEEVNNVWKRVAHNFRCTDYILNISGARDIAATNENLIGSIRVHSPETYIICNRDVHRIELQRFGDVKTRIEPPNPANVSYPRLLVLDITAIGTMSATGQLKSTLLASWPVERMLQIAKQGPHGLAAVRLEGSSHRTKPLDISGAREEIDRFSPNLILYRPVPDSGALHALAMEEIRSRNIPLVTWIMDDWPARMEAEDTFAWNHIKPDLLYLLHVSNLRLSISEAMSDAFVRRYGQPFIPFANGVDPAEWLTVPKPSLEDGIFRVRFAGDLAHDMNLTSMIRIARAVERIANSGIPISLQINTQQWWKDQTVELFAKFRSTQLQAACLPPSSYREWISQGDVVVISYNFDDNSIRHIQYSMANKMPECLASGAVVFAHGPRGVATIDYLDSTDLAVVVTDDSDIAVETALRGIIMDSTRDALAQDACDFVFERHNINLLRKKFVNQLRQVDLLARQETNVNGTCAEFK
jgi:hypothetical protein